MRGSEYAELTAFIAVAECASFTKAAAKLGISVATLSVAVRALETRMGVPLLNRTTRSVATTEIGINLAERLRPLLAALDEAVDSINEFKEAPSGLLKICVTRLASLVVVSPIIADFASAYPEISVEITVDDAMPDIVGGKFDAGIRFAEGVDLDMVAVRVSAESRFLAVASPSYLAQRSVPRTPQELRGHECIRYRQLCSGTIHPWTFSGPAGPVEAPVGGKLILSDSSLVMQAAIDGAGVALLLEEQVAAALGEGRLVNILESWSMTTSGFHIFYPRQRQIYAPLRAFVSYLKAARGLPGRDEGPSLSETLLKGLLTLQPH